MRKKRLFLILGIPLTLVVGLYLARRPILEPLILREVQSALGPALGSDIEIDALRGNWLTAVEVEGLTIRGGAAAGLQSVTGGRVELQYSPWSLLQGDVGGLQSARIRIDRVHLDLAKPLLQPSGAAPTSRPAMTLPDALACLPQGLTLHIDELSLGPHDPRAANFTLQILAGTQQRQVKVEFGSTKCDLSVRSDGSYTAEATSDVTGRILKMLGLRGVPGDDGPLEVAVTGTSSPWKIGLTARASTVLQRGRFEVACDLEWGSGRLRSDTITWNMPGLQIQGRALDLPLSGLSDRSVQELLSESAEGSLVIDVKDLAPYRALLPAAVQDLLPISGRVALDVASGAVQLRESRLTSPGLDLRIKAGSFDLLDLPLRQFSVGHLREASARDIAFELDAREPLTIETGAGPLEFSGAISGTVGGSITKPALQASVALRDVSCRGFRLDTLTSSLGFRDQKLVARDLRVRGAQRDGDRFKLDIDGGGALTLQPSMQLEASATCQVPTAALRLAGLEADALEGLSDIPLAVTTEVRFPDAQPVHGSINLRAATIQHRGLKPFELLGQVAFRSEVVEVHALSLKSEQAQLHASGQLSERRVELKAKGLIRDLRAFTAAAQVAPLSGRLHLDEVAVGGSLSQPDIKINSRLNLTHIAPQWIPAERREILPAAPLDLSLQATSTSEGIDLQGMKLSWGEPQGSRVTIRAAGPAPLRWWNQTLTAHDRGAPLVSDIRVHAHDSVLGQAAVEIASRVELLATGILVPTFTASSDNGRIQGTDLSLNLGMRDILAGSYSMRTLPIRGELVAEDFRFQGLLSRLIAGVELTGLVGGKLTASGNLDAPRVEGQLGLAGGSLAYPGSPPLQDLAVQAQFTQERVRLACTATADESRPLIIDAWIGDKTAPIWKSFTQRTAPLLGGLKVQGLDLSGLPFGLLESDHAQLQTVSGLVTMDGSLSGSWGSPRPSLRIRIDGGSLKARGIPEVEDLELRAQLEPSKVHISRCSGKVAQTPFAIDGEILTTKTELWKLVDHPTARLRGHLNIKDLPLELIPPTMSPWQDVEGVVRGQLKVGGSWREPEPDLTLTLRKAAAKFAALPRIADLESRLRVTNDGCELTASGTLGAEPLRAMVTLRPGEGDFTERWRSALVQASVRGKHLLLMRGNGLKLRGDVDLNAKGRLDKEIEVGGDVTLRKGSKLVRRMSLVPDLKTRGGGDSGGTFGPWTIPGGERLHVDIRLTTDTAMSVRTNVFDADLDIACRVIGQGDALHLSGVCSSNQGKLRFPGMAMELQSMRVMFHDANPSRPKILATASGQRHGVRINMRVKDYWDAPIINLSSSPALPPKELWTFVTTGRRPDSLAAGTTQSNTALIATYVIQELILTYFASESTEVQESFISRFTFEFGNEISRGGQETWKVDLDLGGLWVMPDNFGVQLERDVYEDINLGLVYRWRF